MGTFYGFWTCRACGRENSGKDQNCNGCGRPRDKDTKFYPVSRGNSSKPREYIENYVNHGPDWNCSFCGRMNPATKTSCEGCGHARDESDKHYFELHPERVEVRKRPEDFNQGSDMPDWDENGDPIYRERQRETEVDSNNEAFRNPETIADLASNPFWNFVKGLDIGRFIKPILAILTLVAVIGGLFFLLKPKTAEITVVDKAWERNVVIEEYRTVQEEDWFVPAGGRMIGSYQAIHHYDTVIDHYDTVTKSRQVASGGHYEVSGYQDNGDGTFTEQQAWVTDFTTEYYTEQEPVYVQVPVYQTKYRYDIERWQFDHNETTRGHDDRPYFADTSGLADRFRTDGTTEKYTITATYFKKDKLIEEDYEVDFEKWQELLVDHKYTVKIHAGNRLEFIE